MPRAAILALLLLAGCSTAPTEREIISAHELVGFDWCSPAQLHQCPMIRQGSELFLLQPGERIGDGARVWDERGKIVKALGRP